MEKNSRLQQAVRYAIAAAIAASGPGAFAQTPPVAGSTATLEEVVITGSRLKVANDASISPISSVTATEIQATGLTRVEDVLNNLPMVFAAQGSTVSNGSNGTATVNLRNLGSRRTLVLVNGRRMGPGSIGGGNTSDLNQIPASLIERIDVLTGGASAVYGADAVAGVVNFVLDTKFEGVKVDANYSFNNHRNKNNDVASLVAARGFPLPPGTVNTGYAKDFSILIGANFADNRGNATLYGTYRRDDAVLQDKYDYSSCVLNSPSAKGLAAGKKKACGGSGTAATGYFQAYSNTGTALFTNTVDKTTGAFRPFDASTDLFNFGPLNYYQRPSERYTAGTFLNYDVSSNVNAYAEFMFASNSSVAQIAPSGDFFLLSRISCANPLLTAEEKTTICSPANLAAQADPSGISMYIGRRNVEGGGRQATFLSSSYRSTFGLKGSFGKAWNFDVYGQYGSLQGENGNLNYLSNASIQKALNVVTDPATGQPVCASGPPCVPWNIWVPGGVTAAATKYLAIPLLVTGDLTERVVSGSLTGDLGEYGVKLPTASSGLQVNVGTEWRSERADYRPDAASQAGDAAGSGGPTTPVSGSFTVNEYFTEMRLPLVDNHPGAESLSVEGGYRFSDYSLGFKTDTYKLGLEWVPVRDLRLRASLNRAVRAPNIGELFSPQAVLLDGTKDGCAGATPAPTAAQCAFSGVTAAQYGNIGPNPAAQYNGLLGGNQKLQPEKADTYSFGFVIQPRFAPNLVVSVDYFDIKIEQVIGPIGGDVILQNCIATGNPVFCSAVHRSANGSLWKSNDGFISDTNVNFGSLTSKGVDLKARYKFGLNSLGSLAFSLDGTYASESKIQPLTNGPAFDCVGFFGSNCGVPNPKWRHIFNTTWVTPWSGLDVTLRWRYFDKVASERTSSDPQLNAKFYPETAHIKAYNYFDLSGGFQLNKVLAFRLGVNNLFDKDPPIIVSGAFSDCPTSICNGNSFAQVYDTLGRFVFARATAKF